MSDISRFGQPVSIVDPNNNNSFANVTSGRLHVTDLPAGSQLIIQNGMYSGLALNSSAAATTYSITSGSFILKEVNASAAGGPCKVSVLLNSGTLATGFFSSVSPFIQLNFSNGYTVNSGSTVGCVIKNMNDHTQDVYATILGIS
jgi:hypothetical protein